MDSLFASYASSDDEGEEQQHSEFFPSKAVSISVETFSLPKASRVLGDLPQPKSSSSPFPSLPPPKSSYSPFSSLPEPESSSSDFASLPPPKSSSVISSFPFPKPNNPQPPSDSSSSYPKRVVQFKPPVMLKPANSDDDDDDHEEKEKRRKPVKESTSSTATSSVHSFFSALPAPKNTLGSGSAPSLGAGRRSIVETDVPTSTYVGTPLENKETVEHKENFDGNWGDGSSLISASEPLTSGSDPSNWIPSNETYGSYGNYEYNANYGGYEGSYGNYNGAETVALTALTQDNSGFIQIPRMLGKRGRSDIPTEIVEVKQDELMKNRPREDQARSTGIAFGPSYQSVSTKGKPSKLHKRKHQIGSLYFDMKQNELELAERRSKGFLTKAETQAKYGW
ncbi:hypothetical protein IFM89_004666 [Coptis chinensis]|uniref:Proline-rich protein PRCC n=1 Tax=Coptis chinensis TaxID=261450 RepID=A0A835IAG9_9MAGN|nr:hypothetical protein IFM89_004666 [Coptis chinensis]